VHTLKDFEDVRTSKMVSDNTRRLFLPKAKVARAADEARRMMGRSAPDRAEPPAPPVAAAGVRVVYPVAAVQNR
jgi:hypothetical protein